eukprot:g1188.t1
MAASGIGYMPMQLTPMQAAQLPRPLQPSEKNAYSTAFGTAPGRVPAPGRVMVQQNTQPPHFQLPVQAAVPPRVVRRVFLDQNGQPKQYRSGYQFNTSYTGPVPQMTQPEAALAQDGEVGVGAGVGGSAGRSLAVPFVPATPVEIDRSGATQKIAGAGAVPTTPGDHDHLLGESAPTVRTYKRNNLHTGASGGRIPAPPRVGAAQLPGREQEQEHAYDRSSATASSASPSVSAPYSEEAPAPEATGAAGDDGDQHAGEGAASSGGSFGAARSRVRMSGSGKSSPSPSLSTWDQDQDGPHGTAEPKDVIGKLGGKGLEEPSSLTRQNSQQSTQAPSSGAASLQITPLPTEQKMAMPRIMGTGLSRPGSFENALAEQAIALGKRSVAAEPVDLLLKKVDERREVVGTSPVEDGINLDTMTECASAEVDEEMVPASFTDEPDEEPRQKIPTSPADELDLAVATPDEGLAPGSLAARLVALTREGVHTLAGFLTKIIVQSGTRSSAAPDSGPTPDRPELDLMQDTAVEEAASRAAETWAAFMQETMRKSSSLSSSPIVPSAPAEVIPIESENLEQAVHWRAPFMSDRYAVGVRDGKRIATNLQPRSRDHLRTFHGVKKLWTALGANVDVVVGGDLPPAAHFLSGADASTRKMSGGGQVFEGQEEHAHEHDNVRTGAWWASPAPSGTVSVVDVRSTPPSPETRGIMKAGESSRGEERDSWMLVDPPAFQMEVVESAPDALSSRGEMQMTTGRGGLRYLDVGQQGGPVIVAAPPDSSGEIAFLGDEKIGGKELLDNYFDELFYADITPSVPDPDAGEGVAALLQEKILAEEVRDRHEHLLFRSGFDYYRLPHPQDAKKRDALEAALKWEGGRLAQVWDAEVRPLLGEELVTKLHVARSSINDPDEKTGMRAWAKYHAALSVENGRNNNDVAGGAAGRGGAHAFALFWRLAERYSILSGRYGPRFELKDGRVAQELLTASRMEFPFLVSLLKVAEVAPPAPPSALPLDALAAARSLQAASPERLPPFEPTTSGFRRNLLRRSDSGNSLVSSLAAAPQFGEGRLPPLSPAPSRDGECPDNVASNDDVEHPDSVVSSGSGSRLLDFLSEGEPETAYFSLNNGVVLGVLADAVDFKAFGGIDGVFEHGNPGGTGNPAAALGEAQFLLLGSGGLNYKGETKYVALGPPSGPEEEEKPKIRVPHGSGCMRFANVGTFCGRFDRGFREGFGLLFSAGYVTLGLYHKNARVGWHVVLENREKRKSHSRVVRIQFFGGADLERSQLLELRSAEKGPAISVTTTSRKESSPGMVMTEIAGGKSPGSSGSCTNPFGLAGSYWDRPSSCESLVDVYEWRSRGVELLTKMGLFKRGPLSKPVRNEVTDLLLLGELRPAPDLKINALQPMNYNNENSME